MAKLLAYNATLVERIDLEPTLGIFTLRPDQLPKRRKGAAPGEPWFVPGQYVTIGMNRDQPENAADARPLSVRRAMSIASAPEREGVYELYIRYVGEPESELPLTHVMWPIREGDRLFCRPGAVGKFTLRDTIGEDDPRLKLMVAAGTGLAPFLSMVRSRVARDPRARLEEFTILHGASYPSSLGYRAELEALARDRGLRYLPTISRPREEPGWRGATGRVEALLAPGRLAETEGALGLGPGDLVPEKVAVYICGLQGTIANTVIHLLPRGYVPDDRRLRRGLGIGDARPASIFWEQYDNVPVIDLKDAPLLESLRRMVA